MVPDSCIHMHASVAILAQALSLCQISFFSFRFSPRSSQHNNGLLYVDSLGEEGGGELAKESEMTKLTLERARQV